MYSIDSIGPRRHALLQSSGASTQAHSGRSLLDHLVGTHAILSRWRCRPSVRDAGLFHSIDGTSVFSAQRADADIRAGLRAVVGDESANLVQLFAQLDRRSMVRAAFEGPPFVVELVDGPVQRLDTPTFIDLCHLWASNHLEQHGHVDPTRWSSSRSYYQALRHLLSTQARQELDPLFVIAVEPETTMNSLLQIFRFDDVAVVQQSARELRLSCMQEVASRLHRVLGEDRRRALLALPDDAYVRVLEAPETWNQVLRDTSELDTHIEDAIAVESWRGGQAFGLSRPAWSASGDVYVGTDHEGCRPEQLRPSVDALNGRCVRNPVLGGSLVIDARSPRALRPLVKNNFRPKSYGAAEHYGPTELATVVDKVSAGLDGIGEVSAAALEFVVQTLCVVHPRRHTDPAQYPNSFKGSSTGSFMSRMNLYNAHESHVKPGHVAQSLIHEAVHNHLYKIERLQPAFEDWLVADEVRLVSPWSGNRVSLYAFVHATLVFYALFEFFSLPHARRVFGSDVVDYYQGLAHRGLASEDHARIRQQHGAKIRPALVEQLAEASARHCRPLAANVVGSCP